VYDDNDDFGITVALSPNTALASIIQGETDLSGGIYVFVRSGRTWRRQAILTDPDGGSEINFGSSIAVSGASIVVGASNRGCAFVFFQLPNRAARR
jgi:hypothetical protein